MEKLMLSIVKKLTRKIKKTVLMIQSIGHKIQRENRNSRQFE